MISIQKKDKIRNRFDKRKKRTDNNTWENAEYIHVNIDCEIRDEYLIRRRRRPFTTTTAQLFSSGARAEGEDGRPRRGGAESQRCSSESETSSREGRGDGGANRGAQNLRTSGTRQMAKNEQEPWWIASRRGGEGQVFLLGTSAGGTRTESGATSAPG